MNKNNIHNWVNTALIVLVGILVLVSNQPDPTGGTRFPNGLSADGTTPSAGQVRGTTLLSTGAVTLQSTLAVTGATTLTGTTTGGVAIVDEFTQGGGEGTLTDANGGTFTLTSTQLLNNNVLKFAAGGLGQEIIALTFPATTTLDDLIPNSGDMRTWLYDASELAAATTTTITAGTGFILIAVTANDDLIDGGEWAEITCWRRADTDILCVTSELIDSD